MAESTKSRLTFKNFGGIYQLQVQDAADLSQIQTLEPARWAATSAPVGDLRCDPVVLALLDPAKKGRIRTDEEIKGLKIQDPAAIEKLLMDAPLARPRATGVLPLGGELNPYYREKLEQLRQSVLPLVLGRTVEELTRSTWAGDLLMGGGIALAAVSSNRCAIG